MKESDKPGDPHGIEINGKQVSFEGYLTDYFTDKAIEVIDSHLSESPDKSFFMFLSYTAPHGPMHAKPELIKPFMHVKNEKRRIYAAMMVSLDEGVGRVLQTLKNIKIAENTLVVFLSDNGGPTFKNGSYNGPLKGEKGSLWEGGIRVPFFMQWPSVIPDGQVRRGMASSLDLLPTFASAAGVDPVKGASGMNLLPYLSNTKAILAFRALMWRRGHMKSCATRSNQFKWLEDRNSKKAYLYNLEKDIGEKNNVIKQYPEIAERLQTAYKQWETTVPEPAFKSGWSPKQEAQKQRERAAYEKRNKK